MKRPMSRTPITGATILLAGVLSATSSSAHVVLGEPAPDWTGLRWLDSPLPLSGLRGKVVLVRWWMRDCRLCAATAPALNELHREHAGDGLVVVGVFHPKPRPRRVADAEVHRAAARLGFDFPLAVDADWSVLRRWWLDGGDREYTSVSFLIDRAGIVRWIHPGGEYHASDDPDHSRCDADYHALRAAVERALAPERPREAREDRDD